MLNPDNPYNFEYSPEWKGLNKDMMASEAARRLTFQNWPHMEYRYVNLCNIRMAKKDELLFPHISFLDGLYHVKWLKQDFITNRIMLATIEFSAFLVLFV